MLSSFIITFREIFEIVLIVGIIIGYLYKTDNKKYLPTAYAALLAGIIASLLAALLFLMFFGSFTGRKEMIFEGITMLIGALLLTTVIFWLMKQERGDLHLKRKVAHAISQPRKLSLFLLVFVSVIREGIETVIYLKAASFSSAAHQVSAALLGMAAAFILGYIVFLSSLRLNLKVFFAATNIFLILFAAGLIAQSVHEFEEAEVLPGIISPLWNTAHIVSDEGLLGGFLKGFFGYISAPSLLAVMSYLFYLGSVLLFWRSIMRTRVQQSKLF